MPNHPERSMRSFVASVAKNTTDILATIPTTILTYLYVGFGMFNEIRDVGARKMQGDLPMKNSAWGTDKYLGELDFRYDRLRELELVLPNLGDFQLTGGDLALLRGMLHLVSRNLNFKGSNHNVLSQFSGWVESKQNKSAKNTDRLLANHPLTRAILKKLGTSLEYASLALDPHLPSATRLILLSIDSGAYVEHPLLFSTLVLISTMGTLITINDIVRITGKILNGVQPYVYTGDEDLALNSVQQSDDVRPRSDGTQLAQPTKQRFSTRQRSPTPTTSRQPSDQATLGDIKTPHTRKVPLTGDINIYVSATEATHIGISGPHSGDVAETIARKLMAKGVNVSITNTDSTMGNLNIRKEKPGEVVILTTARETGEAPGNTFVDPTERSHGKVVTTITAIDKNVIEYKDVIGGGTHIRSLDD